MRKYLKIIIPFVIILVIGVGLYGYSEFHRGHRDVANQKADVTIAASDLIKAFSNDETKANTDYLNKAIAVSGKVKSVDKDDKGNYTIQLEGSDMSNVSCEMDERHNADAQNIAAGSTISVKGTCTGMLMDVVLIRCAIDK